MTLADWSRYELAEQHKSKVRSQAWRLGIGPTEAEEVAHSVAIGLVFDPATYDSETLRRTFLTKTKWALKAIRQDRSQYVHASQEHWNTRQNDEVDDESFLGFVGKATQPNQIEYVYLKEILTRVAQKTGENADTILALAVGETPLDLLRQRGGGVEDIFKQIAAARDWLAAELERKAA